LKSTRKKKKKGGTDGTNEYGFSALPNGDGSYGYWWSTNENGSNYAYCRTMGYIYGDHANWDSLNKSHLHSVRCLKD
jgi:uncharacterized protein (TIGR02145 family)